MSVISKRVIFVFAFFFFLTPFVCASDIPKEINYQGYVTSGGSAFGGTGYFKFALVNSAGDTTYWSNDGTSAGGGEPTASVSATVSSGVFNIILGDTTVTNMTVIPTSVFSSYSTIYLRVWFRAGASGSFELLSPDKKITSSAFAYRASTVESSIQDAIKIGPYHTDSGDTGELRYLELAASGSEYVGFKSPDSIGTNKIWVLPNADGTNGQVLTTDGSSALSWSTPAGTGANKALSNLASVAINTALLPGTDDSIDLGDGTTPLEFRNAYIDGTANIDSLVADTADINGGTIDSTVIGGSSAAAGTFTGLNATSLALSPSTTGTIIDASLEDEWTTGTILNADYSGATTLTGALNGIVFDFVTNVTATGQSVLGSNIKLPAVTNTGVGTYIYLGHTVSSGPIVQNTAAGTTDWTGYAVSMPDATVNFAGATVNTYGLTITGGTPTKTAGSITYEGINVAMKAGADIALDIAKGVSNFAGLLTIAPQTTGTVTDYQLETEWTTGTLINADFAGATVQSGDMIGISLNFNSNLAGVTDQDVTGFIVSTPALTQSTVNTTNYIGYALGTAGALIQDTLLGTINWKGLSLQMPNITQTTGTANSYGVYINGGTITSGTTYGIYVNMNASSDIALYVGKGDVKLANDIILSANSTIETITSAGEARAINFNIPISAGGAADLALDYQFKVGGTLEAGLLAETDGAGSYKDSVWKIPYMTGAYGAAWATFTAPAPTSLANGSIVVAYNSDTASSRLYTYSNSGWIYGSYGASDLWTQGTNIAYLTTTGDALVIGTNADQDAKLVVVGDTTTERLLLLRAPASMNDDLFRIETSLAESIFKIEKYGNITLKPTINTTGLIIDGGNMEQYALLDLKASKHDQADIAIFRHAGTRTSLADINLINNYISGTVTLGTNFDWRFDKKSVTTSLVLGSGSELYGVDINLSSNITFNSANNSVYGFNLVAPAITQSSASTKNIVGYNLPTAGALIQNTLAGSIAWSGVNIQMPAITQTTGTVSAYGIDITGGVITSGTAAGIRVDMNASTDTALNIVQGGAIFTDGLRTKYSIANVSNPPTDTELDSAFGSPTVVGSGFVGVLDDNGGGTDVYICYTTGTDAEWFYLTGTKAL